MKSFIVFPFLFSTNFVQKHPLEIFPSSGRTMDKVTVRLKIFVEVLHVMLMYGES